MVKIVFSSGIIYLKKLLHVALELVCRSIGVLSLSVNNANWLCKCYVDILTCEVRKSVVVERKLTVCAVFSLLHFFNEGWAHFLQHLRVQLKRTITLILHVLVYYVKEKQAMNFFVYSLIVGCTVGRILVKVVIVPKVRLKNLLKSYLITVCISTNTELVQNTGYSAFHLHFTATGTLDMSRASFCFIATLRVMADNGCTCS